MPLWPVPWPSFQIFFAVLLRVSVVLFLFPFFNARMIPASVKAGLAFAVALVLAPHLDEPPVAAWPGTSTGLFLLILAELAAGLILALMVQVFFEGVRMMGQLVGFQTGFAITNIIDPQSGSQVSILANLAYLVALLLFLAFDGHHILLAVVQESFAVLPVGALTLDPRILHQLVPVFGGMFALAVKLGAPAIAVLLFTKVAFGLIVKLIPQMNIMIVAFPVQIVLGLFFFGICLHALLLFTDHYVGGLRTLLMQTLSGLAV